MVSGLLCCYRLDTHTRQAPKACENIRRCGSRITPIAVASLLQLVQTLETELQRVQANKGVIVATFSESEYSELSSRWNVKLQRAKAGEQLWGRVTAVKPQP